MHAQKMFLTGLMMAGIMLGLVLLAPGRMCAQQDDGQPATKQHGPWFTDKDGDGYHDYAPDHDGDGVPNGSDPDYLRMGRGAGRGMWRATAIQGAAQSAAGQVMSQTTGEQDAEQAASGQGNAPAAAVRGTWRTVYGVQGWARPEPKEHGPWFVDNNGDGYHDYAPDHDGDGVPNGRDPEYIQLRTTYGSGGGRGGGRGLWRTSTEQHGPWFTDRDGDGYHDYAPDADGDGIPNGRDSDYVRPRFGGGQYFTRGGGGGFYRGGRGGGRGRGRW